MDLVQTVFSKGRLAEETTWQEVVLLTKGGKEYCGMTAPVAQGHHGPPNNVTRSVGYYETQKMMAME